MLKTKITTKHRIEIPNTHTIQESVFSRDSNNAMRYVAESVSPKMCYSHFGQP